VFDHVIDRQRNLSSGWIDYILCILITGGREEGFNERRNDNDHNFIEISEYPTGSSDSHSVQSSLSHLENEIENDYCRISKKSHETSKVENKGSIKADHEEVVGEESDCGTGSRRNEDVGSGLCSAIESDASSNDDGMPLSM